MSPAIEKIGLSGKIDPYAGVVIRTIPIAIVGLVGLLFMGKLHEIPTIDTKSIIFICLGGLLAGFLGQITYYSALKTGDVSLVVPVVTTYPLITLLISIIFLGEAFTIQKLIGIVMIISGILILK